MITQLHTQGEITEDLKNYYTTFIASIFRSVRFGASSAHGKANMIRFNYFLENGAFVKNEETNEDVFIHASGLVDQVKEGDAVTFE